MPQSSGWERKIAEGPPCVVLASPGFMQSGPSRQLLELWAPDSRNGLIVTGYSVEGTLARVSVQSSYGLATEASRWSLLCRFMYSSHTHGNRLLFPLIVRSDPES